MTDDEQMAGVVGPCGERDIDEARRQRRVRRRRLIRFERRRANRWRDTRSHLPSGENRPPRAARFNTRGCPPSAGIHTRAESSRPRR